MNEPMDANDLIAEAAMELLREHGPQTAADWGTLLADAGHGTAEDMAEFVEYVEDPLLGYLSEERYAALDTLFEHRVLTHRLTEAEIKSGVLDANPDLMMLRVFLDRDDDEIHGISVVHRGTDDDLLADRGIEDPEFPHDEGFLLDTDTLAECSVGDLIGLFVADRELTLCTIPEVLDPAPGFGEHLATVLADIGADTLDAIVWQLMLDEPSLFRQPTAPLGEMLEASGYVRDGDYVAVDGFDFEAYHLANRARMLEVRENLHPEEAASVIAFVDVVMAAKAEGVEDVSDWARKQIKEDPQAFAGLAEPPAAAAALELLSELDDHDSVLHSVATALAEKGSRRVKPAAHWLAGKASDRLGKILAAEASYESAHDLDPDWTPAIFDLALLAADRSDVTRALALLGRIEGGESEVLHEVLQRYAPAEHPELGRNDKCWCGSGRKFKVCHLGKSEVTFDDRASWLYVKAQLFSRTPEYFDAVFDLALIRAEQFNSEEALTLAVEGGLAVDAALFDAGIFAAFVERRGEMLPADERELADQWLSIPRSVYKVASTEPGQLVTLSDVRNGHLVKVTDEWGSLNLEPGTLVCARVLPAGSTMRTFGGIEPLAVEDKKELIQLIESEDTEPGQLVEFLSRGLAGAPFR
ncbi:SEC-C domain-containing protein [Rhodococcus qingshengii]|uniref:SEC-C domain-containing protein n=1 Tax=Rhodococcus qingshengii TaxID=334542 RepID=UPI001EE70EC0|nr:SEC-C domain-containing protein [Rhodococcus qingshengii]